ncbi:MAG TPA: hypothetical protein VMS56_02165 [Thermoanaerobaculia bacterium]|nr:hypothetical protein [Thermoanaerobaculia bacterium]
MAVKLPDGLRGDQIRILQEFRRLGARELAREQIDAIRHPTGGGADALNGLLEKGYLRPSGEGGFALEPKSDEILGIDHVP